MITLYKTTTSGLEIRERQFTRVTGKTAFYLNNFGNENRELLETNYSTWHRTREDAILHLQKIAKSNLESAEWRMNKAKEYYEQAMQLKP